MRVDVKYLSTKYTDTIIVQSPKFSNKADETLIEVLHVFWIMDLLYS